MTALWLGCPMPHYAADTLTAALPCRWWLHANHHPVRVYFGAITLSAFQVFRTVTDDMKANTLCTTSPVSMLIHNPHPQGEGITSGLRKVTDDMKAKNRADRSGVVPATAAPAAPAAASVPAAAGTAGRGGVPTGEPK